MLRDIAADRSTSALCPVSTFWAKAGMGSPAQRETGGVPRPKVLLGPPPPKDAEDE